MVGQGQPGVKRDEAVVWRKIALQPEVSILEKQVPLMPGKKIQCSGQILVFVSVICRYVTNPPNIVA